MTTATPQSSPLTNTNTSNEHIRATKRKLDDAFHILDSAVGTNDSPEHPPPLKRANTIQSLYSTLAKYGIKSSRPLGKRQETSNLESISKKTPHLTAILSRAATRTRKALPFRLPGGQIKPAPPLPSTAEYRPSSTTAFLSRLSTFKLATYANKPSSIDAVAAAKCGWVNEGKDRLVCGLCHSSWVVAGREGMGRDAANALIEKQKSSLVSMHKDGCPWKSRQCDPSIYCVPLQSPSVMVRELKKKALSLEPLLQGVEIKHPLTMSQLGSLRSTITCYKLPSQKEQQQEDRYDSEDVFMSSAQEPIEPSDTAILTALFGWSVVPPVAPEPRKPSLSRSSSVAFGNPSPPSTPSLSRASSVARTRPPSTVPSGPFTFRMPSKSFGNRDSMLLHCVLCQRRVGLWAFTVIQEQPERSATPAGTQTADALSSEPSISAPGPRRTKRITPQRQFDLLKEHRSFCPYVVRSTIVPSLPVPTSPVAAQAHTRSASSSSQLNGSSNNAFEGWRAVLTVILRYGLGQRRRIGLDFFQRGGESSGVTDADGVKAMVEGVKSRGGKDILQYVRGLLS